MTIEHETHKPDDDDLVDRATAALRDAGTPDGPSPELLAQTWSALEAAQVSGNHHDGNPIPITGIGRRFLTVKNVSRLAIAAVLALFVGVLVWTGVGGGEMAFADVLQKVNQIHSVRFKADTSVTMPNTQTPTKASITMMIRDNRMRQELPGGVATIMDFEHGQGVTLMTPLKRAMRMKMENIPKEVKRQNILENFRSMHANQGKPIGRKEIDGKSLEGYKVDQDGQKLTVWADPKTRLPMRVEVSMDIAMMPKTEVVMKDFEWDANVDESLMSMEIPAGYEVQEMSFDASKPTERDLLDTFRSLTGGQPGGKYPDRFDMTGIMGSVGVAEAKAQISKKPEDRAAATKAMQKMMKDLRGLTFVRTENGSDFHYAGKGATFGKVGRPVFWYRPTGSETYHVIDADLAVHTDVAAADLPKVESQELKAMGKGFGMTGSTTTESNPAQPQ